MRLVLEVISGAATGKTIEVRLGQVVSVGRTRKANITLGDNFMSGTHFAVKCDSTGCRLEDLKSRNGTKLNGELVLEAPLKNGDRVFAGSTDFKVRIYEEPAPSITPEQVADSSSAAKKTSSRRKSGRLSVKAQSAESQPSPPKPASDSQTKRSSKRLPQTEVQDINEPAPIKSESRASAQTPALPSSALNSYEAATPDGRLLKMLSSQPQALMALIDAAHDAEVLDLLRGSKEHFHSLYRPEQKATIAPYLVGLPPGSEMLRQMIKRGWGRGWGVYLTCSFSIEQLRDYFRSSLMVSLPDGTELFSRFYDPRFFRGFLTSCTANEAEKFFGPVSSYLMEDERSEILLEFRMGNRGVEKKGYLLSDLG